MVSTCSISENGDVYSDYLGDNNGREYYICDWYDDQWGWVLRYPDINVAVCIAEVGRDAANNNHIGYGWGQRTSYYSRLRDAGWQPSNITTDCESDCSASTIAAVIAAGHLKNVPALQGCNPGCSTADIRQILSGVGFQVFTSSDYTHSPNKLLPGDIILKRVGGSGHVIINLDAGPQSGSTLNISGGSGISGGIFGIGNIAQNLFIPRIQSPDDDDVNYINTSKGGNNKCAAIQNNGSVLPNCVGYAWGRFMEILGSTPKLCTGNASDWYGAKQDNYERGTEPRVGAVACWSRGNGVSGHVAIVESVHEDGGITTSNSDYGSGRKFYMEGGEPPNYKSDTRYTFQGFIYCPINFSESTGGSLYDEELNDEDDAVLREVAYLNSDGIPTTSNTGIRMSIINYTSALASFFEGAIAIPGAGFAIGGGSVDMSSVDISNMDSVAKAIFQFFTTKGLNAAAACGIMGNMMQESSMKVGAYTSDPNNTYPMRACGLCQWTDGGRYNIKNATAMIAYVGNDWATDLSGQLDYLWRQITENFSTDGLNFIRDVYQPLLAVPNNTSGVQQAVIIFEEGFERASNAMNENRIRWALTFWNQLAIQLS